MRFIFFAFSGFLGIQIANFGNAVRK